MYHLNHPIYHAEKEFVFKPPIQTGEVHYANVP